MADSDYTEPFLYALWRLKERGDPAPLRKQLAQMERTRTGRQMLEAQKALDAYDRTEATSS